MTIRKKKDTKTPRGLRFRGILLFSLCLALLLGGLTPLTAHALNAEKKTVRVGWYESTYCYWDQYGERRGIAYEYQRRIAAHTGWTYEYVVDSWPNLLQMLIDGEIDMLSDVSYKPERAELMLFSSLAMGAESYYLYIDADNADINPEDAQSLNGKRVGINKGSFQVGLFREWAEKNNVTPEIVELTDDEGYSMKMLAKGEIDALVSMDSFGAQERVIPVTKIGASDYYFAVKKDRPDLLAELNYAMSAIQDEDPYFNQRLFDEYVHLTKTNAFLLPSQDNWLEEHGEIRVGYRDNYLPFCASDKLTGEVDGALKDYLAHAAICLKNAQIHFEAVPYPSTGAALAAMKNGEIDCVFPVNISTYSGETMGILTINPIMKTEMSVLVRPETTLGKNLTVAIEEGNTNYETLIRDGLSNWTIKKYPTVEACFRAVEAKEADGVLAGNYSMNEYEPLRTRYSLIAIPTGETMGLSIAVNDDYPELYSILNKIANLSPAKDMEYALVGYMYADHKVSFMDFLEDNWISVLLVITVVFALLLFLLYQKLNAERDAVERQKQVEEALKRELAQKKQLKSVTQIAYTDPLTGIKNKTSYAQWEEKIDAKIETGEQEPFAVVICDINNLKVVNDKYGHKEGDACIKRACSRICATFSHSPVFRLGGDEFAVILSGEDYSRRQELMQKMNALPGNPSQANVGDVIATGMVEYDKDRHHSLQSVCEEADRAMYERKQLLKNSYYPAEPSEEKDAEPAWNTAEKYEFPLEERMALASLPVPFAVYQFINRHVVTLVLSEGFCQLFGYRDQAQAYLDMDHDMYKDTHPDDVERVANEALRFATEDGAYDVRYRTRSPGSADYHVIHATGKHIFTSAGARLAYVWYTDEGMAED